MHSRQVTHEDIAEKTSYYRLLFLSLVLVSPALLYGLDVSFPAIAIPLLNLNLSDASWFGSISMYLSPISTILAGIIIDKFGRKTVLICSIAPNLAGWLLLYWNYNVTILLLGQVLNGLTMGSVLYPMQVYAGECILTNNVRLRNCFMVYIGLYISLGTFVIMCLSNFLNYSQICLMAAAITAILLVTFFLVIPESPTWLHLKGRTGDAEWAEKKLGVAQPILRERLLADTPSETSPSTTTDKFSCNSLVGSVRKLRRPDVYKPLLILSVGNILLPFCGQVVVMTYMINILSDTMPGQLTHVNETLTMGNGPAGSPLDANRYGLICTLFTIAGALFSSFVLPVVGMRNTMMASLVATKVGLLTLTYCSFNSAAADVLLLRVGAVGLVAFLVGIGMGPLFAACGDMFPVDAKGFASISSIVGNLALATGNKTFPYLYAAFQGYTYCLYTFMTILSLIYFHFLFPEIVGKTLDEINEGFIDQK